MVVAVVDDHTILDLLAADPVPPGRYATTCSWWWRLTSALAGRRGGALSRRLSGVDPRLARVLRRAVADLPAHLDIVELRLLIPAMGVLARAHTVNQLAAEAVAAAAYLDAPIEVAIDTPQIAAVAAAERIGYRVA